MWIALVAIFVLVGVGVVKGNVHQEHLTAENHALKEKVHTLSKHQTHPVYRIRGVVIEDLSQPKKGNQL